MCLCSRTHTLGASASSITTRIKTVIKVFFACLGKQVRVHLPLQQGLRLFIFVYPHFPPVCASASSITTRIKTVANCSLLPTLRNRASASSITTRIKTQIS